MVTDLVRLGGVYVHRIIIKTADNKIISIIIRVPRSGSLEYFYIVHFFGDVNKFQVQQVIDCSSEYTYIPFKILK